MIPTDQNQDEATPRVNVTSLLSNAAMISAVVGILGILYTLFTGKHFSPDQTALITQLIPLVGILLVGLGVKHAKQSSRRSIANVVDVMSGHLYKIGETKTANDLQAVVGKPVEDNRQ